MTRAARAAHRLGYAFQFGKGIEQPGIITAANTATWHTAGMIEQLRSLRADQMGRLQRGELGTGPLSPGTRAT